MPRSIPRAMRRRRTYLDGHASRRHRLSDPLRRLRAGQLLLIAVNLLTTPDRLWFYWPLLGWGIGILAHGLPSITRRRADTFARRSRTRGARSSLQPRSARAAHAAHALGHQLHDLQRELRLLGDEREERRLVDDGDLGRLAGQRRGGARRRRRSAPSRRRRRRDRRAPAPCRR